MSTLHLLFSTSSPPLLNFDPKVPTESYLSQLSWQDSPLYSEMQPEKRLSQAEPPCPAADQQPLQLINLWEQYSDPSTGRSYYVNSVTKERSWKPPRRARGRTPNKVARWLEKMVLRDFYFERNRTTLLSMKCILNFKVNSDHLPAAPVS